MRLSAFIAAALVALALTVGAAADPARDALNRGDLSTAMRILRAEAESGNPDSQIRVGDMYRDGKGVKTDVAEAVKWYRMAADQRYLRAQIIMGDVYRDGFGVPRDYAEAAKWYKLAADRARGAPHISLAKLYAQGLGVPRDLVEAYKWYTLYAIGPPARNNPSGIFEPALAERDAMAASMPPEQIAEGERLAREWKPNW